MTALPHMKIPDLRRKSSKSLTEVKQMYIPEFWCGVAVTIGVELGILIGVLIYFGTKGKK